MRKEDEQAIKRALAILRVECQEHRVCSHCKFYNNSRCECMLNIPPMYYDVEAIINRLE